MRLWMWGAVAIAAAGVHAYKRFTRNLDASAEEVVGTLLATGLFALIGFFILAVGLLRSRRVQQQAGPPGGGASGSA